MPAVAAWRYFELGERVMWIDVGPSVPDDVLVYARRLAGRWSPSLSEALTIATNPSLRDAEIDCALAELRRVAEDPNGPVAEDLCFISEELWEFDVASSAVTAATGPMSVCVGAHGHDLDTCSESLRYHLEKLEDQPSRTHLARVSTHDTVPPPPGVAAALSAVFSCLPMAAGLVFSGAEWSTQLMTNAEFGVTPSGEVPSESSLGLFNDVPIDWTDARLRALPLDRIDAIHTSLGAGRLDGFDYQFVSWTKRCFGFRRRSPEGDVVLAVVMNFEPEPMPLTSHGEDEAWLHFGESTASAGDPPAAVEPSCAAVLVTRPCMQSADGREPGIARTFEAPDPEVSVPAQDNAS